MRRSALLTDLYELTMMQGYHAAAMHQRAVFDMFFRRQPFGGGFAIFAGLADLLDALAALRFDEDEVAYLASLNLFDEPFLDYLRDFSFSGDVWAVAEGSVVFPHEPLIRVHTTIMEAQLIESLLLNTINFQTLIATKSARIVLAATRDGAAERPRVAEFGLRRAQGVDGAVSASRAAYIGGAAATSNTLAGMRFGIPVTGTMAHSWVMAFESERDAFDRYAALYPTSTTFLIDTYDTLGSGLDAAIAAGRELVARGHQFGVRLDSGDIQYLSKAVRRRLDAAGLPEAKIAVSNELDEQIIYQLVTARCPVDLWGVGTQLVTGGGDPALTGVYKLAARETPDGTFIPTMKVSDNPEKSTNPGIKQVYRFLDEAGAALGDLITLDDAPLEPGRPYTFYHPDQEYRVYRMRDYAAIEPLLQRVMAGGQICAAPESLHAIRARTLENLGRIDETYKRIINPHIYKVSLARRLKELKRSFLARMVDAEDI